MDNIIIKSWPEHIYLQACDDGLVFKTPAESTCCKDVYFRSDIVVALRARIAELEARQVPEGRRTGDRLCELKTQDIIERDSYKHVGYILHREHRGFCLVNGAAVRWLTDDECWQLMHGDAAPSPADSGEVKP